MKFYVAVTDNAWFDRLLALHPPPDEVNFWLPGGRSVRHEVGTPWLFKLHAPENKIAGIGYFTYYTSMPLGIVWEAFEERNGVRTLSELRDAVARYRDAPTTVATPIGCAVLSQPVFWHKDRWLDAPADWSKNIVSGKLYDTQEAVGGAVWSAVQQRLAPQVSVFPEQPRGRYGEPRLVRPRLGQGAFRLLVTDAYGRRCAVTQERALPVLEAAHIVPFADRPNHEVRNGLLLRADLHRLFDKGYVSVDPSHHEYRFVVSRKIHEEFDNGREYYALHGRQIGVPEKPDLRPDPGLLEQHLSSIFLG
jgi:putative restriction endonuclease